MKRSILFALFLIGFFSISFAQSGGEIQGRVVDQNNEGIPFANVVVFLNDVQINGASTDLDGYFSIKPISPGRYKVVASYIGKTVNVNDVIISAGKTTFLNKIVVNTAQELGPIEVVYKEPAVDVGKPEVSTTVTREQIEKMPKNNIIGMITNTAGTYSADDNSTAISVGGSRFNSNKYILDGVDMSGIILLPPDALDQIQVITSGVDASIGDFTGGVFKLSTRGGAKELHGSVEVLTSQYLDPYGYNQARFSLLGPIYSVNKGTDQARTIIDYILTGDAIYEKDSDPPATPIYVVKDEVLDDIKERPLQPSLIGEGLNKRSEFLRMEDLEELKYKPNNDNKSLNFFGKVDFRPSLTTQFTLGSTFYHQDANAYVRTFSLLNAENNPQVLNTDYRVYGKFTQRFPEKRQEGEERKSGYTLGNAYYSLQVDFQKSTGKVQDAEHKDNFFNYGYIGDFDVYKAPFYYYKQDTIVYTDANGIEQRRVITANNALLTYFDTLVTFERAEINPYLSNYTSQYFNNFKANTLSQVIAGGGLRNGDFTQNLITYSMWYNAGVPYTSYSLTNNTQYGLRFDASLDLKKSEGDKINRHAIEFGFEYQQKDDRSYGISPIGLWGLARQNMNFHLLNLETDQPYFIIDGDTTLASDFLASGGSFNQQTDTLFYYRRYSQAEQKYFDIAVREKLGVPVNSLEFINIDGLDLNFFDITLFSPEELLASGNRLVTTRGYDYYGNKLDYQPSFNDFWSSFNDKDGDGVKDFDEYYERSIDAYRPIYTAGYIQDRFNIGRVIFRVGLRVDRFDANQKVLRDQYSLYAIRTAGEVTNLGPHPSTIGEDFAVYTNDVSNPTEILGYRNGTTWYNAAGNEIFDPSVLTGATTTGTISPYLVDPTQDIKQNDFNVDQSFKDYDPQYTFMPRIAFSFPITETAMFTAHYDIYTQRPLSGVQATPYHYMFLQEIAIDGVIPNPNLKPEKTINYQLGFQQALSDASRLSISAFYKELRDMTQIIRVDYAYPVSYTTYGNIDFGTVKGLKLAYDVIRRINNTLISASYTLQFADGTGSNATSQINLIGAQQPNLRTILPLNYDVRHVFMVNLDYRFASGKLYNGPKLFNEDILANAGINLTFRGRSGEPFTRQANATPNAQFGVRTSSNLEGSINGSRLPWNYKVDFRVDKDFTLGGQHALNVYLLIQNLFNTKNIIAVYRYTGDPDDDGYLEAPGAQQGIAAQLDPQSFIDLYRVKIQNPDYYSLPRTIQLGVKYKF